MSPKLIAINCVLLAIIVGVVQSAVTTVRPYKFGFTIDEQQHRAEQRDERGIVMGEFGFITADGIYHVTVYATDEDGKFRIISMKSYPYAGPVTPKILPALGTTSTTTKATPQASLPKYNFNTEACSGCFLKKTPVATTTTTIPPKTEIRTLSQPLAPSADAADDYAGKLAVQNVQGELSGQTDRGLNVQLPFRASIAQTIDVATRLGLPSTPTHTITHHKVSAINTNTNTNTNTNSYIKPKQQQRIDLGIELAMNTYTHTKEEVTGHVRTMTQHNTETAGKRLTMVDYAVGVTKPKTGLPDAFNYVPKEQKQQQQQQQNTLSPLHIKLDANAVKDASKYIDNGVVSSLVDLESQPRLKPAIKAANQVPIFAVQERENKILNKQSNVALPLALAPGQIVDNLHEPLASQTVPLLSHHPLGGGASVPVTAFSPTLTQINSLNPTQYQQQEPQQLQQLQHKPHTQLTQSTNQQNQRLNKPSSAVGPSSFTPIGNAGANAQTTAKTPSTLAGTATRIGGSPLSAGQTNIGGSPLTGGSSIGGAKNGAGVGAGVGKGAGVGAGVGKGPGVGAGVGKGSGVGGIAAGAGSPLSGSSGNKFGDGNSLDGNKPSGGFGGSRGAIGSISGDTGDLYRFKYLLDYNGHEETGSRNGNKQGNYFAIGEDAVLRTIEYIANEFGFQPHVSWRKLDPKDAQALPEENSLKHYEFKWFNKAEN